MRQDPDRSAQRMVEALLRGEPESIRSQGDVEGMNEPKMPIRDADLRQAAWQARVTVGDPVWNALVELQERRDSERIPAPDSVVSDREREIL